MRRNQVWDINGKLIVDEVIPPTREELIEHLKEIRDRHWTGGCNVGSVRIQTDQESISNLTGAYTFGKEFDSPETPFAITWSLGKGQSVTLDLPTLRLACAAVMQHIQACNTRYLDLYAKITAGEDLLKIEADLETGWPE